MGQHLEIEFKNLVTEDEFNRISTYFGLTEQHFILQENDYFDTLSFDLKGLGCALRVRKKNGQYELTLKEPQQVGLLETNQAITEEQIHELHKSHFIPEGPIYDRLITLGINIPSIRYFGTLKTWRAEVDYFNGFLVFDKSQYLNKQDYELEYEVTDFAEGEKNFLKLLNQFDISRRQTDNKIVRFYKQKQRQDN